MSGDGSKEPEPIDGKPVPPKVPTKPIAPIPPPQKPGGKQILT